MSCACWITTSEPRTGLELLRETITSGCATPVILLTGNDDWDTDVEAMEAGAADYLIKGQFGIRTPGAVDPLCAEASPSKRQHTLEALRDSEERYAAGGARG